MTPETASFCFCVFRASCFAVQKLIENICVCKGSDKEFFESIPKLDDQVKERFADCALEIALQEAKQYPAQMQDLIVAWNSEFIDRTTAMMVLDLLYADGTFHPLTDRELITANLIMFSDVLPKE